MNTRRMSLKLIAGAVGVASMLGLTSVASAAEHFNWYGGIRAGAVYSNSDEAGQDAAWDLGATEQDGTQSVYSRIGVRGSTELDDDTSVGFQVERNVGAASLSQRHHNVWLGGGWGRLTLGQQGNSYRGARNWDQTYFVGGNVGNDSGSRVEGIKYSSNLSGPFNFTVMATGNDAFEDTPAVDAVTETEMFVTVTFTNVSCPNNECLVNLNPDDGTIDTVNTNSADPDNPVLVAPDAPGVAGDPETIEAAFDFDGGVNTQGPLSDQNVTYDISEVMMGTDDNGDVFHYVTVADTGTGDVTIPVESETNIVTPAIPATTTQSGESSVDGWIATARFDAGPVVVNVGHDAKTTDGVGYNNTALGVNGSFGAFEWYASYESASDNSDTGNDRESYGGFAGFGLSESDFLYLYHVNHEIDMATDDLGENPTETILGYSHSFGPNATFITEYLTYDKDTGMDGENPTKLVMAVKVDF